MSGINPHFLLPSLHIFLSLLALPCSLILLSSFYLPIIFLLSSFPPFTLNHLSSSSSCLSSPPHLPLSSHPPSIIPSFFIIDWSIFRRILRASASRTHFHLLSHWVGVSHLWLAGCRCRWTIRKHGISSISVITNILLLIFVSRWSFYTSHYCYLLIWQDIIVFFATYIELLHTVTRHFSILMSTISH